MLRTNQLELFDSGKTTEEKNTSSFIDNMKLPVHRWFRYSAGFSAQWVASVIADAQKHTKHIRVLDPFAGSATTLIACEDKSVESCGVESHPFIARLGQAKLFRRSCPGSYRDYSRRVPRSAKHRTGSIDGYPPLIRKCYMDDVLSDLNKLRAAVKEHADPRRHS